MVGRLTSKSPSMGSPATTGPARRPPGGKPTTTSGFLADRAPGGPGPPSPGLLRRITQQPPTTVQAARVLREELRVQAQRAGASASSLAQLSRNRPGDEELQVALGQANAERDRLLRRAEGRPHPGADDAYGDTEEVREAAKQLSRSSDDNNKFAEEAGLDMRQRVELMGTVPLANDRRFSSTVVELLASQGLQGQAFVDLVQELDGMFDGSLLVLINDIDVAFANRSTGAFRPGRARDDFMKGLFERTVQSRFDE